MTWDAFYKACKTAPKTPTKKSNSQVTERMDVIDSGKWSVDDVLEMQVDELSMAGNVGSGTDRAVGSRNGEKDQWSKLQRAYEDYLAKTRSEASATSAKNFVLETSPGSSNSFVRGFLEHLRTVGYAL